VLKTRALPVLVATILALFTLVAATWAQAPAGRPEPVDFDALYRIKDEGLQRSQVMETLWYLTDVHGPRLTNSPNIRAAAAWVTKRLNGWDVTNVRQESWGPFGRGWVNEKLVAHVIAPQPFPLIAFPRAWTPGTNGAVTVDAVHALIDDEGDFKDWEGKLKGKAVFVSATPEVRALFTAPGRRFTDQDLADMQAQPVNAGRGRGGRGGGRGSPP
jgi:carboxypeptidase Q